MCEASPWDRIVCQRHKNAVVSENDVWLILDPFSTALDTARGNIRLGLNGCTALDLFNSKTCVPSLSHFLNQPHDSWCFFLNPQLLESRDAGKSRAGVKETILDTRFFLLATGRKYDSSQTQGLSKSSRQIKLEPFLLNFTLTCFSGILTTLWSPNSPEFLGINFPPAPMILTSNLAKPAARKPSQSSKKWWLRSLNKYFKEV